MTTVADDGGDITTTWLDFAKTLFQQAPPTWYCTSWVPWTRYVLTILVIVIA